MYYNILGVISDINKDNNELFVDLHEPFIIGAQRFKLDYDKNASFKVGDLIWCYNYDYRITLFNSDLKDIDESMLNQLLNMYSTYLKLLFVLNREADYNNSYSIQNVSAIVDNIGVHLDLIRKTLANSKSK